MNARGQADPFTLTESPFASASAMIEFDFVLVDCVSESSSAASRAMDANEESIWPLKDDESMKVAETEVISRTARDRDGAHGRIECQFDVKVSDEPLGDIVVGCRQVRVIAQNASRCDRAVPTMGVRLAGRALYYIVCKNTQISSTESVRWVGG